MEARANRWPARVWTSAIALLAAACSSSSGGGAPSLFRNWIYVNGTKGLGLTLTTDQTYVFSDLQLTSSSAGDAQVETGTFAANGDSITFTPQTWTCPGPDPVATGTYSFQGSDLEMTFSTAIVSFQPNNSPASSNFALALGCFDTSGNFKSEALAPVTN